jgi:hypothetical protein
MLLKTYTFADVEAAIARTNAISLSDLKAGNDNRNYSAQGSSPYVKGTGHVFAHVATYTQRLPSTDTGMSRIKTNQGGKSLWQNRRTAIYACLELLNKNTKVRDWLKKFDEGKRAEPIDVIGLPLTGDFYGYAAGETELKKATQAAINIFGVSGVLSIYSTYPTTLTTFVEPDLNLSSLFGN